MYETDRAPIASHTSKLDKSAEQTTYSHGRRKPQYLDVVLARDSKDLAEARGNVKNNGKNVLNGKDNGNGLKRTKNSIEAGVWKKSNKGTNVEPKKGVGKLDTSSKATGKNAKSQGKISTFQEKAAFESQKNRKLYEELDRMLIGEKGPTKPYQNPKKSVKELEPPKPQKKEKFFVATKDKLYPTISQEARDKAGKYNTGGSYQRKVVSPLQRHGSIRIESEAWHNREVKANLRLEKLDKIDDFDLGDFTPKTNRTFNINRTAGVGVPVQTVRTSGSRRHIVADIPIYVPTFAGGNIPVQQVVQATHPVPIDKVFQSTNPGQNYKPTAGPEGQLTHAQKAFVPVAESVLDSGLSNSPVRDPELNTYRVHGNPVKERLLLEKTEAQRAQFEKESLQYFDVEPEKGAQFATPGHASSFTQNEIPLNRREIIDGTLLSDPGPGRRSEPIEDDLARFKYSPEGYLAEKERKLRLEKESRVLYKNADKTSAWDIGDAGLPQRSTQRGYGDTYRIDIDTPKTSRRPIDKDNSWVKVQLDTTHTRTPVDMDTYRSQGHTARAGSFDPDRDTHRSYQIPNDMRDRDRYSDNHGYSRDKGSYDDDSRVNDRRNFERDTVTDRNSYAARSRHENDARNDRDPRFDRNDRDNRIDRDRNERNDRNSNFGRDIESDRDVRNDRDARHGRDTGNDREARYERDTGNDRDARYGRDTGNDRDARYERDTGNDRDARYGRDTGNDRDVRYGRDTGNVKDARYGRDTGNGRDVRNDRDARYGRDTANDRNVRNDKDARYGRNTGNDRNVRNDERDLKYARDERNERDSKPDRDIGKDTRYDSKREDPYPKTPENVGQTTQRDSHRVSSFDRPEKQATRQASGGGKKVQYVLRSKSRGSKAEMRDSQMSYKSDPLPENIPPSSTELIKEKSYRSSQPDQIRDDARSAKTTYTDGNLTQQLSTRQPPVGSDKVKSLPDEAWKTLPKPPTYEPTAAAEKDSRMDDQLSKYFDDPEKPGSRSDIIPFYSDNASKYSKQKNDIRNGDVMTPVQEMSFKHSEQSEKSLEKDVATRNSDNNKRGDPNDPYYRDDRKETRKFPPDTTVNKHEIKEDRRSPWKQEEPVQNLFSPTLKGDQYVSGPDFPKDKEDKDKNEPKGVESVERIKDRIREKTLEKLREKSRQKTMDSQGPTPLDVQDEIEEEEVNLDNLNLDDIETEVSEKELYVCYLQTEDGDTIGPLKLDLNDIQIGLPKPLDKQEQEKMMKAESEQEGMRNRQTGSHGLNEFSSRSHSMLMLTIDSEQQDPDDENLYITKRGKLTFVDLAGSEKVKDSNSTADTLVESNSINKSLLVLGNCISSLGDHKRRQGHIPYRDSKLTKLLADSLGGNGVTLMICCITPSSHHVSETMNTLRYASRAKKIRTKPVIKMDPREKLILSLKKEIKVLRNENHYLRQQLDFPAKPKGQLQKENDQKFLKMVKETNGKATHNNNTVTANGNVTSNGNEKMKQNGASTDESGLYEMLQEYMVENEALRSENAEMQVTRDKIRQDQQLLYRDNEKLMKKVDELERRISQAQSSWQSMPRQGGHPDPGRSRDHSPRGSPQYVRGPGSGGRGQPQRLPPPSDLPIRDNPALRDPVYPGSPPQGYASPTGGNGKGKQAQRGAPMKPPHRLADPIPAVGQQRPVHDPNSQYMNGHHPGGHGHQGSHQGGHPGGHPAQYRQAHIGSPNRVNDLRMDSRRSSQSSSSDAIRDMNEKLKQELMQLEGEIHHHQNMNTRPVYGSQGPLR